MSNDDLNDSDGSNDDGYWNRVNKVSEENLAPLSSSCLAEYFDEIGFRVQRSLRHTCSRLRYR
jgi:hypothetical protein